MADVSSQNDTNIDGDVTGRDKINVEAPRLDAIVAHLADSAAQLATVSAQIAAAVALIQRHDAELKQHREKFDEFAAGVLDLFEDVFEAVDSVSGQIDISGRLLELQVLVDGAKTQPRKRRKRGTDT